MPSMIDGRRADSVKADQAAQVGADTERQISNPLSGISSRSRNHGPPLE